MRIRRKYSKKSSIRRTIKVKRKLVRKSRKNKSRRQNRRQSSSRQSKNKRQKIQIGGGLFDFFLAKKKYENEYKIYREHIDNSNKYFKNIEGGQNELLIDDIGKHYFLTTNIGSLFEIEEGNNIRFVMETDENTHMLSENQVIFKAHQKGIIAFLLGNDVTMFKNRFRGFEEVVDTQGEYKGTQLGYRIFLSKPTHLKDILYELAVTKKPDMPLHRPIQFIK